jgi:hypothetical protein
MRPSQATAAGSMVEHGVASVGSQAVPVLQNNCQRLKGCDLRNDRAGTVVLCVAHVADMCYDVVSVLGIPNSLMKR